MRVRGLPSPADEKKCDEKDKMNDGRYKTTKKGDDKAKGMNAKEILPATNALNYSSFTFRNYGNYSNVVRKIQKVRGTISSNRHNSSKPYKSPQLQ